MVFVCVVKKCCKLRNNEHLWFDELNSHIQKETTFIQHVVFNTYNIRFGSNYTDIKVTSIYIFELVK